MNISIYISIYIYTISRHIDYLHTYLCYHIQYIDIILWPLHLESRQCRCLRIGRNHPLWRCTGTQCVKVTSFRTGETWWRVKSWNWTDDNPSDPPRHLRPLKEGMYVFEGASGAAFCVLFHVEVFLGAHLQVFLAIFPNSLSSFRQQTGLQSEGR